MQTRPGDLVVPDPIANQKKLKLGQSRPPDARPRSLVMQKMDQDFKKEAKRSRSHDGKFQVGK